MDCARFREAPRKRTPYSKKGASSSVITDGLTNLFNDKPDKSSKEILDDAMTYGLMAGSIEKIGKSLGLDKLIKIPGISKGRNIYTAIYDSFMTKFSHLHFSHLSYKTIYKMVVGNTVKSSIGNSLFGLGSYIKGNLDEIDDSIIKIGDFIREKYNEFNQWGGSKLYEFYDAYFRWAYHVSGVGCTN